MMVDKKRIKKYLFDILSNLRDIESLLKEYGERISNMFNTDYREFFKKFK